MNDKIYPVKCSYELKTETMSIRIADLKLENYNLEEKKNKNGRQRRCCYFVDLIKKMVFSHFLSRIIPCFDFWAC